MGTLESTLLGDVVGFGERINYFTTGERRVGGGDDGHEDGDGDGSGWGCDGWPGRGRGRGRGHD